MIALVVFSLVVMAISANLSGKIYIRVINIV